MTPREKALKLHIKFYDAIPTLPDEGQMEYESAKQCSLIAVDEIINNIDFTSMLNGTDDYNYWLQVIKEIQNL
jgi:hypothetical protein